MKRFFLHYLKCGFLKKSFIINDFLRNPHFSTYLLKTWVFNIILVLHFFPSFLSTYVKRLNETKAVCRKTAKWSFQSENPKGVWKLRVDCSLSAMKPKSFWSCFFSKKAFQDQQTPLSEVLMKPALPECFPQMLPKNMWYIYYWAFKTKKYATL